MSKKKQSGNETTDLTSSDNSGFQMETETSNPKKAAPAKQKAQKSGQAVTTLALFISIAALILSGYIGWRALPLEKSQPSLITGQEQLQAQIARQQARLTEAVREINPLKTEIISQQERSQRLLQRTDSLSQSVNELAGTSRTGWKLAEVEYLLRLANQRLLMNADTKGAQSLLESADSILVELNDYLYYDVRSALAEDLSLITTLPNFDQEGLYLKLDALSKQIAHLPLLEKTAFEPAHETPSETTAETDAESSGWKNVAVNMLKNTVDSFVSLFRFTPDRAQPVKALLPPEEDLLIRQNLQLMLEQTKLATLSRNQTVYDSSLQQSINWINNYFTLSGSAASAMTAELKQLQGVVVKPSLPNITHALDAMKMLQQPAEKSESKPPAPAKNQSEITAPDDAESESQNNEGQFVPEGEQQS